jgi:hypothetical protein
LTELDATPCKFPRCDEPTTLEVAHRSREAFFLCEEHRQLLLDDPRQFRRRWDQPGAPPKPASFPSAQRT